MLAMQLATKQMAFEPKDKGKKHKRRQIQVYLLFSIFLLLSVTGFCSGISFAGYQTYHVQYQKYLSVAQAGVQHLRTAVTLLETLPQKSLDPLRVTQAQREFTVAASDFVQLDTNLKSLPA